jgi:predicted DNA-binding transcriptional regulator AlpA
MSHDHPSPTPPSPTDDALITAPEARRLAGGISDMSLWRWIRDGVVPPPRIIRARRYWPRGEFLAALHSASRQSGKEAAA